MQPIAHLYARTQNTPADHQARLIEEIALLEARLHDIGLTGDCAYEKSLARSYDLLLRERRRELSRLGADRVNGE